MTDRAYVSTYDRGGKKGWLEKMRRGEGVEKCTKTFGRGWV